MDRRSIWALREESDVLMDNLTDRLEDLADEKHESRELGRFLVQALASLPVRGSEADLVRIRRTIAETERRLGYGWSSCRRIHRQVAAEDVRSLKELTLQGLCGVAAFARLAAAVGREDDEAYASVIRILRSLRDCQSVSRLMALALDCGQATVRAMDLLDEEDDQTPSFSSQRRVLESIHAGLVRRLVVMGACGDATRSDRCCVRTIRSFPQDVIVLIAGCSPLRYVREGEPSGNGVVGVPHVLDAGRCDDSRSLVRATRALRDLAGDEEAQNLPLGFDISWHGQIGVCVLLALLALGFRDIRVGSTLPPFLSIGAGKALVERFGLSATRVVS